MVVRFDIVLSFSGVTYPCDEFDCFDNVELSPILGDRSVIDFGLLAFGLMNNSFEF